MKQKCNIFISMFMLVLFSLLLGDCSLSTKEKPEASSPKVDFVEIQNRGTLVAGVSTNSTDYFVFRGKPMGFQLEILNKFCERYNLKLKIVVQNDLIKIMDYLENRDIDLIAQSLTVTPDRKQRFGFSEPIAQTRQVLVQRAYPFGVEDSAVVIKNQLNLAGKTIHIQKGSASSVRLAHLADEIADSILVLENDTLEMEELIQQVSLGKIDYTVCDENVAIINKSYFKNINIATPVSFPQNLAWAVRKESVSLKDSIDNWLLDYKKTAEYKYLYQKYYKSSRAPLTMGSEFYSGKEGKISAFDFVVKDAAEMIGWDWRLLASLIYQESRFDPTVESWAGAFGIMQLMPATAEFLGVDRDSPVEEQIYAGARFIQYLDNLIPESVSVHQDRVKFILAGYNVGFGHVQDAIRLAEKYGKNPDVWENNVEYFLVHKSNPKYYQDEVVMFGYCSGNQPVNYVNEIIERYEHYRNVIPLHKEI